MSFVIAPFSIRLVLKKRIGSSGQCVFDGKTKRIICIGHTIRAVDLYNKREGVCQSPENYSLTHSRGHGYRIAAVFWL